jgi:hypothetical protein
VTPPDRNSASGHSRLAGSRSVGHACDRHGFTRVRRLRFVGAALLACTLLPFAVGQVRPRITAPTPARNYTLSLFSDQGYHRMHVRGTSADLTNPARIALSELTLTLFTGDSSRTVETVILSPQAVLEPEKELVAGDGVVRLIRDDLELTGENWQYDHGAEKILIQRNARIVFQTPIGDLLK